MEKKGNTIMLKSGFARVDITPPLGLPLSGYFRKRPASGVLDPLEINALAVSDGENTAVILTADFSVMTKDRCDIIRKKVSERCGIPVENVMVTSLHQHTSLRISFADIITDMMSEFDGFSDDNYIEFLYRRFCDSAQMAIDDMKESTVSVGIRETAEPISFIRRYIMKDGSLQTNPGTFDPSEIDRPNGVSDNTVRLIKFSRKDAKDIALVNFSTHPDVIGGCLYSADWPGFTRRFVEAENADVSCMMITGFQGDSNHLDFIGGRKTGYEHSRHMGRVIADTVRDIIGETRPISADSVSMEIKCVYNKTNTSGAERYDEAKKYYDRYLAGEIKIAGNLADVAEAQRILNINKRQLYNDVRISVIKLGDIVLAGIGGEPFTAYGDIVRAAAGDRFAVCACCTNGYAGYLPVKTAFDEGGYEARSSNFTPELEEQVTGAINEMLK